ncbi:DUF2971 domain-containing protein [Paraburkholderia sp. DGU8]|uniref:DUF2971 domain-containing protein n=1 Tax=Paraburkholderia sp. DGU8 TaxID=3161997 RepID=UPI003467E25A
MDLKNATHDGHAVLYHYQSFNACYLERTLRDRTIHMAKPSEFNDPWDCRPWFDATDLDDPDEREKILQWICRTDPLEDIEELRRDTEQLRAMVTVTHLFHVKTVSDVYRVYCLTPDPLHPLMWSHYGGGHKGIALEFDATTPQMQYAFGVSYRETYPPIRMYEEGGSTDLVPIYTKSDVWEYEHEYRLVGEERTSALSDKPPHGVPMVFESNLRLMPGVLTGVVLGCRCDEPLAMELIDAYGPDLRVHPRNASPDRW